MICLKRFAFIAASIALAASLSITAKAGELRAGAAKVLITPAANEFPFQSGHEESFVGVHDDVFARALVLDDGKTRVVLVVEEVTAVPDHEKVVAAVAKAAGVPESNVIVSASHTHESINKHADDGAVEAAAKAAANLQPASISFGRGAAYVNINNGEAAGLTNWYDPTGPSDKTLDVVRIGDANGKPIAMIVNYATHGETMFRSLEKDGGALVTGDIPGAVSRILEGSAGVPVVLYTAAAEADQLGIFKSVQPAADNLPQADEGAAGFALVDVMARRLAIAVLDTEKTMPPAASTATVQVSATSVSCPGRAVEPPPGQGNQGGQARQGGPGAPGAPAAPNFQSDGPPVVIPVTTIRLNEIALVGVAADLGSQIGQEIRTASPLKNTTVITQMAGSVGYVLPDSSYVHPGHGLRGSRLKPGCIETALPTSVATSLGGKAK